MMLKYLLLIYSFVATKAFIFPLLKKHEFLLNKISNKLFASVSSFNSNINNLSPRVQKIKDISVQKEIIKDITASEFALRLEIEPDNIASDDNTSDKLKSATTTIDYEKLIQKLNIHLDTLQKRVELNIYSSGNNTISNLSKRILQIKEDLELVAINLPPKNMNKVTLIPETSSSTINVDTATKSQLIPPKVSLRLLVREDGTVDWDGAIASGKEVAKFGTELWERLNGKEAEEGIPSLSELFGQVPAKEFETNEIKILSEIVTNGQSDVMNAIKKRDDLKIALRIDRRDGKTISQEDIEELRKFDIKVKEMEKKVKLLQLNLDMEKVCVYIQQELESSASEGSDQMRRYLVAEVALIDKQIMSIGAGLIPLIDINNYNDQNLDVKISDMLSLVDDDELNLICAELTDLKNRLGVDTQLVPVMDWGSLGVVVSENLNKIKVGLSFFGEGTKLLLTDIQYAWFLMLKAIRGFTLKPREVNAIRRTGKDLLTLIPFTIILIIPLSPVGHVLVFSFIQRFFPEFYPSCYTEKRLNLGRLFSEIERKKEDDILGEEEFNWFLLPNVTNWINNIQSKFNFNNAN